VAGALLAGTVQRLYFSHLPDAALRGVVTLVDTTIVELTAEQRLEADTQIGLLAPVEGGRGEGAPFEALVEQRDVSAGGAAVDQVAYYAGAVAALFVLLSAVHAAAGLHEDFESGLADRVLAGPGGVRPLVDGRALFLVAQGVAQAAVIFTVAWLVYGVDLPRHLPAWAAVTAALAVAAAGLMLGTATLCRTSRQSHTVANVGVLIVSAVGGSMVPRFLMPQWLQQAGWATPNAWAIDGYAQTFRLHGGMVDVMGPAAVLAGFGVLGWMVARRLAVRWTTV
jgi:ABC-2 type transport system permease protein